MPACASLMRAIDGAARGEPLGRVRPAEIRTDRLRPAALGALRPARRHHRPALLRALRAVGTARPIARRRRLGRRQPAISLLRGTADLRETLQELQQAGTLPIAVEADFERFIAGRRALLDERLTAVDAQATDGMLPDVTIDQGRAEDRADREIDTAGGRGPGRAALRHAAAHPHHRPAVRGGRLDAVPRLLHPSAHRRDRRRQPQS